MKLRSMALFGKSMREGKKGILWDFTTVECHMAWCSQQNPPETGMRKL